MSNSKEDKTKIDKLEKVKQSSKEGSTATTRRSADSK